MIDKKDLGYLNKTNDRSINSPEFKIKFQDSKKLSIKDK